MYSVECSIPNPWSLLPDSYKISESNNQAYTQFGNSVVVDVLQLIGMQIGKHLSEQND